MKVGIIGAGTMGFRYCTEHLHRQKDMKYAYVILMTNLQQTEKLKLQKDLRRELQKAKWSRQLQMLS